MSGAHYIRGMDAPIPFGERLQACLDSFEPPRTQAWLAERAGVERSTVSRLLKGERHPTLDTLQCLAPALGVSVDELVQGTDAQEKIQGASQLIHRETYNAAVSKLAEYESKLNDTEAKLRAVERALSMEQEHRKKDGTAFLDMRMRAERLGSALETSKEENRHLSEQLQRYREALHKAVGQISVLQVKLTQMADELKKTSESSRTATFFAGIAALTGVVTAASFLGGEEPVSDDSKGQQKAARKRSKK